MALFLSNANTSGADLVKSLNNDTDDITNLNLDVMSIKSSGSGSGSTALSVLKRVASPSPNRALSTGRKLLGTSSSDTGNDSSDIFTFTPGDYIYNFEHPIPASTPESISATFGTVFYALDVYIERYGAFKSNISTSLPINIVRAPSDESVEDTEPIAISRDWEDQLHYDIIIASKSLILNAYIPIAFKLIPLDKIKLHRIRVFLTENVEYYCKNKKVHRMEPTKKYLLLEHRAPPPKDLPPNADSKMKKSGNLLTSDGFDITAKEFEFQVYVPQKLNNNGTLHPNTTHANIKTHHWIKICLRLSRMIDGKAKHYEISIDSPIHILHQSCSHANTLLPAYGVPNFDSSNQNHESNIYFPVEVLSSPELSPSPGPLEHSNSLSSVLAAASGSIRRKNSISSTLSHNLENFESTLSANIYKPDNLEIGITSPQAIPVSPINSPIQRPIHLLRKPSFDPPSFDEDVSPPPISRESELSISPILRSRRPSILQANALPNRVENSVGIDGALNGSDFYPLPPHIDDDPRSYTPLNSPPPPLHRNGLRDDEIPMDPPTYDDFLEEDGMMSPFLRFNNGNFNNPSVPEIILSTTDSNDQENENHINDDGDLGDKFAFKGGSLAMPASVLRATSPVGQRKREQARTPRSSFDYGRRSSETIDRRLVDINPSSSSTVGDLSSHNNNTQGENQEEHEEEPHEESAIYDGEDENEDPEPYSPSSGAYSPTNRAVRRMTSGSSLSPKNQIPEDINDNDFLFQPFLHSNSTSGSLVFPETSHNFHDRFESRESISIRREPSSVDITSLYSHNNPFVIPNVTNLFDQNIASQRRHSSVNKTNGIGTTYNNASANASIHSNQPSPAVTRQNSINPILSALDEVNESQTQRTSPVTIPETSPTVHTHPSIFNPSEHIPSNSRTSSKETADSYDDEVNTKSSSMLRLDDQSTITTEASTTDGVFSHVGDSPQKAKHVVVPFAAKEETTG